MDKHIQFFSNIKKKIKGITFRTTQYNFITKSFKNYLIHFLPNKTDKIIYRIKNRTLSFIKRRKTAKNRTAAENVWKMTESVPERPLKRDDANRTKRKLLSKGSFPNECHCWPTFLTYYICNTCYYTFFFGGSVLWSFVDFRLAISRNGTVFVSIDLVYVYESIVILNVCWLCFCFRWIRFFM